jgi:hypothetical protein
MEVTKTVMTEMVEVMDIFCNKCGESCKIDDGFGKNQRLYAGIIDLEYAGPAGNYERSIEEGSVHKFALCEKCLAELIGSFKIDSFQFNFLAADEDENNELVDQLANNEIGPDQLKDMSDDDFEELTDEDIISSTPIKPGSLIEMIDPTIAVPFDLTRQKKAN